MKQMKEELEMMRHNVTPSQFLSAVRSAIRSHKFTGICADDINLAYWKAGNDFNFDIEYKDPESDPCKHEKSVSRPYEMQTYVRNWDGTVYNMIIEFQFDDEKRGFGYFYFINTWNETENDDLRSVPDYKYSFSGYDPVMIAAKEHIGKGITIAKHREEKAMDQKKQYHIHKAKEHKKQYNPVNVRLLAEAVAEARKLRRSGEESRPVSDLMEQVEEYDGDPDDGPHWYLIDDQGDTFESLMKATTPAQAARELIREWDALSPHDQKDRKAFYAAYGTKDRQGDILYGDDGYEISLNIPPKSVSLDNGNSYDSDVEYLMQECGPVEEGNLWDPLVENMDDDTRELVESMDPVNNKQFLEWYLLLAPEDLVVG